MEFDDFAKDYYLLSLRINKHIDGYVEHYYGPSEFKKKVDIEELLSPKTLLKDYKNLFMKFQKQDFDKKRYNFLDKTLIAIETILRILSGEKIPYLEQTEKLFNFKPVLYDDAFFLSLTSKAEKLYKGEEKLSERIKRYARQRTVAADRYKFLFTKALRIVKQRTKELFPSMLPNNENVEVLEVKDQSWPMYCWYKGSYASIIEINISTFHYWTHLLRLACHEGYPGHHTERSVRENLLFHKKGYFESSILLIYSPEIVISEGIGVLAESVLYDPTESARILLEDIIPTTEKEDSLKCIAEQSEIRSGFGRFESNLAYHKHVHNWTDEKLIKYAKSFKVITDEGINGILKFISDKIWAPYALSYQGERLITEKFGNRPSPEDFRRLICEQTLPSDLSKYK